MCECDVSAVCERESALSVSPGRVQPLVPRVRIRVTLCTRTEKVAGPHGSLCVISLRQADGFCTLFDFERVHLHVQVRHPRAEGFAGPGPCVGKLECHRQTFTFIHTIVGLLLANQDTDIHNNKK